MADPQTTKIPKVPIRSPMWEKQGAGDGQVDLGNMTRTWIYFLERLGSPSLPGATGAPGPGGSGGPSQRTLLLRDTTVGNDIADNVTVYGATKGQSSTAQRVLACLRKAITADLTVRVNVWISGSASVVGTFTIPQGTPAKTVLEFTTFTTKTLPDESVLSWDVTASDGSKDNGGVAAFTLEWE